MSMDDYWGFLKASAITKETMVHRFSRICNWTKNDCQKWNIDI